VNRLRIAHLRYVFGAIIALISIMALPQTNRVSGSNVDRLPSDIPIPEASTPVPSDKNSFLPPEPDSDDDFFSILTPDPLSKNGSARPVIENPSGETWSAPPDSGSRNDDERMSSTLSSNLAAVLAAGGSLLTCGASGNTSWTTTSSSFQVIRQCTLTVPQAGWVFISTNGSVARQNGEYEALFEIGIDTISGDADIDRWVNIYDDSGDGTDESVALSVLKPVTAGTHTFYFLGKRYGGSGTVLVYDPTLTVIAPGAQIHLPLVMKGE